MATRYEIVGGPDKFTFIDAFAGKSGRIRRTVTFDVRYEGEELGAFAKVEAIVHILGWADETGERWRFKGEVRALLTESGITADAPPQPNTCEGLFTTNEHSGWIEL